MIVINLMTKTQGEIKKFLDFHFGEDTEIDNDIAEWIYVYRNKKDALKIMDSYINNIKDYKVSLWIQIGDEDLIPVKERNYNEVIDMINN